ncbi:unnamed protein product [Polarella glacialis]|uniref:Glycosyltransferase 2-like domain-containing protein n=1 Tax=Polarella glacialis TaxID=89957 RepID=A0A813IHB8_POLGL|nr:unnamed protein product [Polarella glacialis]
MAAREVRKRRSNLAPPPPEIDVDADIPVQSAFARIVSGGTTPRSTLGSPLTSHAYRRSGIGDLAGGKRRNISLSEVELLPWVCCMAPAILQFVLYSTVIVTSLFFPTACYVYMASLAACINLWIFNLASSSFWGSFQLRKGTATDWHALLQKLPDEDKAEACHIVLLPNFKENEKMLKETLDNLGRSRMALNSMKVVLAMEAREGTPAREKAARIIKEKAHLFSDLIACYHPEGLTGEVAGKSSNTQWAFREALRRYGSMLAKRDPSKVFLTVADADTLLHPQYFSALAYQGLTMSPEERSWCIFQSPILLFRNIFSVPFLTRATAHATLIFELASLANQTVMPAFAYSAYSMTLALACHPEVDGWDVDVIAEDHHMFCKCYFAALWESAHECQERTKHGAAQAAPPIAPRLKVQPIYLPALSYLVESSEGYMASLTARFQQARRHMQGVIELGYVLLQYSRFATSVGTFKLPFRTHVGIVLIVIKIFVLHILSTAQCFSMIFVGAVSVTPRIFRWVMDGNLMLLLKDESGFLWSALSLATSSFRDSGTVVQALISVLSSISCVFLVYSFVCWIVMVDLIEGRYHALAESAAPKSPARAMQPVREVSEGGGSTPPTSTEDEVLQRLASAKLKEPPKEPGEVFAPGFVSGPRSLAWRLAVLCQVLNDTITGGRKRGRMAV